MKKLTYLFTTFLFLAVSISSCGDNSEVVEFPVVPPVVPPGVPPVVAPDVISVVPPDDIPEFIIVPGHGLNDLKLGDLGKEVEIKLGDGFETLIASLSGATFYYYNNQSKGIRIILDGYLPDLDINELKITSFILYNSFTGETTEGIKIGSSKEEVIATYGHSGEVLNWDINIGMRIFYNDMDRVNSIIIRNP